MNWLVLGYGLILAGGLAISLLLIWRDFPPPSDDMNEGE